MPEENTIEEENEWPGKLREERSRARAAGTAGGAAKTASTAMRAGGGAAQAAFKGTEVASRGVQTAGKAGRKAGTTMVRVGAEMSGTGLGAIAGIPLMAVGGATAAAGTAAEVGGKVTEEASKAGGKAAKKTRQAGGKLGEIGEQIKAASELRADKAAALAASISMAVAKKLPVVGAVDAGAKAAEKATGFPVRKIIITCVIVLAVLAGLVIVIAGYAYANKWTLIWQYKGEIIKYVLFPSSSN